MRISAQVYLLACWLNLPKKFPKQKIQGLDISFTLILNSRFQLAYQY